ncbi:MAG: nucleoside phosphorylase [Bacteroidales bacterium]
MSRKIGNAELILNPDGSIYHLNLLPEDISDTIIIVGDASRVNMIAAHFDRIELEKTNRDFHTITGSYQKKRITALSTGIGPGNIDIAMNELDALVNINLKTRHPNPQHKTLNVIRLGTSGALQPDIPINSFVVSSYGLGMDGLIFFYEGGREIDEKNISDDFIRHTHWPVELSRPYIIKASEELLHKIGHGMIHGITATSPGFYGPQGRIIRLQAFDNQLIDHLAAFKYEHHRVVNFEMETSILYGMCQLLGHNALTVCVAVANRPNNQFSPDYKVHVDKLIKLLLERLSK